MGPRIKLPAIDAKLLAFIASLWFVGTTGKDLLIGWRDRSALEISRAKAVDELNKMVSERGGLVDKVAAMERRLDGIQHDAAAEYTRRLEAEEAQRKLIEELKEEGI